LFEGLCRLCYHGFTVEINVLIDEGFEGSVEANWLKDIAEEVLIAEGASPRTELGLVITGQEKVRELNAAHLGKDVPTDVLAFPMLPGGTSEAGAAFVAPPDGAVHLGEVIVSYPQAAIQAQERHHPVAKEVAILVVHGILHLLGYDHDAPDRERRMRAREAEILSRIEEKGR